MLKLIMSPGLSLLLPILWIVRALADPPATEPAANLLGSFQAKPDQYAGKREMNGIRLADFPNFSEAWRLVTVRFREDTKEMRFTYANSIAWESLMRGDKEYPKGAVFAKTGFIGEHDPAFTSSVVPSGAKRYQFMVRNKKKFADTDGWGYALFTADGFTFNGDPKLNSLACAACHRLVANKGYVFSERMLSKPFVREILKAPPRVLEPKEQALQFVDQTVPQLGDYLPRLLPEGIHKVRAITGEIQKHIFEGTLQEIGPSLVQESIRSGSPAVLVSDSGREFAFAYGNKGKAPKCPPGHAPFALGRTILTSTNSKKGNAEEELILKLVNHCQEGRQGTK